MFVAGAQRGVHVDLKAMPLPRDVAAALRARGGGGGSLFAPVETIAIGALFRARDSLIAPARCLDWKSLLIGAHQQG